MMDRMIQGFVALWFSLFAGATAFGIGRVLTHEPLASSLDYTRFASKLATVSFLAMMTYLTLVRGRPVARANGWQPAISAVMGANLMVVSILFLRPRDDLGVAQYLLSTGLILAGNALSVYVLSYLGRSFSILAEARRLVADGPYRLVRHPLYLAEEIAILGVFIQFASVKAAVLVAVHFAFQLMRMVNEEKLLSDAFPEYPVYMERTARLVPGIW